ncbi:MAG: DEAD/DEAH box helicase, partial [Prevotellaceae bacterium]|nr:DEAD/DEAH box helicase [Prevotellaceae bacterium]
MDTDIKFLPGVGPHKAELLYSELGIITYRDLLYHFPFRYIDRTHFHKVSEVSPELPYVQLYGEIVSASFEGAEKGNKRLVCKFVDTTGSIDLVFFRGLTWIKNKIEPGKKYVVFGKANLFNGWINIVHPEIDLPEPETGRFASNVNGIYPSTEKLRNNHFGNKLFVKLIRNLLGIIPRKTIETLPPYLISKYRLLPLTEALLNIHFPQTPELLTKARNRLKFDEVFYIQMNVLQRRNTRIGTSRGFVFGTVGSRFNHFFNNNLPFSLTEAQKRVVREMRRDMGSGKQMNRLLQGDVGSGKTLVALMIMLIAADNGFQSCLMAPTEILASQHCDSIAGLLKDMPVRVDLLTGSTKKRLRKEIFNGLEEGTTDILIGTHALIEDNVRFRTLGLVIIDE